MHLSLDPANRNSELPLPELAQPSPGSARLTHALPLLTDSNLLDACGVAIAFTTRDGGVSEGAYASLNLADHVGDNSEHVAENRRILLEALNIPNCADCLVNPVQVHGDTVAIFTDEAGKEHMEDAVELLDAHGILLFTEHRTSPELECDAVVCTVEDVPVMLCYADCVPIILVAPNGCFAVVHSGWKGTLKSIAEKAAHALSVASGCPSSSFNAYIGPHIGACCYEVSDDILDAFVAEFGEACDAFANHLDLEYAVVSALRSAGVESERIVSSGICTSCSTDRFYSYRAEGGTTGRIAAIACRKGVS